MSATVAEAVLWVVRIAPFLGAAIVVYRLARAFQRGEVLAGKRARRLSRSSHPGQFWFEMALHVVVAAVLFFAGLAFNGLEPRWLRDWMN